MPIDFSQPAKARLLDGQTVVESELPDPAILSGTRGYIREILVQKIDQMLEAMDEEDANVRV